MVFKMLAALLVVGAGVGLGFGMAEKLRQRPRQLRLLQYGLTMLQGEIRYRQSPLPAALEAVAAQTKAPVGDVFALLARQLTKADGKGLAWAWGEIKPGIQGNLALLAEDLSQMDSLMLVLGSGGVDEQDRQLTLHLRHLQQQETQAEKARQAGEKMWCYLGLFSGLALVIILL